MAQEPESFTFNTPSQNEALNYVAKQQGRRFIYWLGGVRSGKSYGAAMCFLKHFEQLPDGESALYMILGYTAPQVCTIYSEYLAKMAKQEGFKCEVSKATFDPSVYITDEERGCSCKFMFRGADRDQKASAIQGLTINGLLCDEVANLNKATVFQAEARCSEDGALRVYTSNKTNPYHWTVSYYVNRLREKAIKGLLLDCDISENQHISDEYADERRSEYTGDELARFIDNSFTLDDTPLLRIQRGPNNSAGADLVFIYSHEFGTEILTLTPQHAGGFLITKAKSYDQGEDPFGQGLSTESRYFLNASAPYVGKRLRAMGLSVRAYNDHGDVNYRVHTLQEAIKQDLLRVVDTKAGDPMLEAIELYSEAGRSDHPIITALEGTAEFLHNYLVF